MKMIVKILQMITFGSVLCAAMISLLLISEKPEWDHPLTVALGTCATIMISYMVLSLSCRFLPYPWVCNLAGTHFPTPGISSFDGASSHSKCKKCDEDIMQDGQGNWF